MQRYLGLLAVSLLFSAHLSFAAATNDPGGAAIMTAARNLITTYDQGQPRTTNLLRVVYFVPKNGEPLPHYEERLDRVMNDISDFYRDELRRFGFETAGLPLERKDGKLVLHMVHGRLPAQKYNQNSGDQTAKEVAQALAGAVDLQREYVLIFYALCEKKPGDEYVFGAPYYGDGASSQKRGLCHVADCELLDPLLLTDTNRQIFLTEHNYQRLKMTVAQLNSWYLGGVAHELGHALGLPHDNGGVAEKSFGTSIMGGGNLTYRQEIWGGGNPEHHLGVWAGKAPTYLGLASALQLASHPLFSGSDHGRWNDTPGDFKNLDFSVTNGAFQIQGVLTGAVPPYAVIAYAWPKSASSDHGAVTFPAIVTNGTFTLDLAGLHPENWSAWNLRLARLYCNGASIRRHFWIQFDSEGKPDLATLEMAQVVGRAEEAVMRHSPNAQSLLCDSAIAAAPSPETQKRLRLLRSVLEPATPFDLASVQGNTAFLSDAAWTDAKVGWGQVARNHYWFDDKIQNGVFLTLSGQVYDKGLYAHSSSRYLFPLDQKWNTFTAIGLRDGANIQGSAIFTVRGDGRELYRSRMLRVGDREEVKLDISKVKNLELLTEGAEGHNFNSWAIWAEPKVSR